MGKKTCIARMPLILAIALAAIPLAAETAAKDAQAAKTASTLTESQAYKKATDQLIAYFRDVLMVRQDFIDTFGSLEWDEYEAEVADSVDICRDRKMETNRYADEAFAFTGTIFDLYAEIAIDRATGKAKKILIELDTL